MVVIKYYSGHFELCWTIVSSHKKKKLPMVALDNDIVKNVTERCAHQIKVKLRSDEYILTRFASVV
jgi:hypothetical protein